MKTKLDEILETIERDGPPEDEHLNLAEQRYVLPRMEEIRLNHVVCGKTFEELQNCLKKYGVLSIVCFGKHINHSFCVRDHNADDLKDDCFEEYIALRSKYRETKDPKVLHKMKSMLFPSKFKPEA